MVRSWKRVAALTAAAVVTASVATLRGADEPAPTLRDGFESPKTAWQQEQTDTTVNLLAHERSNRAAHEGQLSERFQFVAGLGSTFFYSYALLKVPVTDDLKVGLYVRSNRGGVRLYGRVVLPADTDPDTGQPSFVLVPGTIYDNVDRWQRLELIHMLPSIERQARVLRASTRRPVSLEGAYLERLVVNLFGGVGDSEAFLDELTVTPVPAEAVEARSRPAEGGPPAPEAARPPRPEPSTAVPRIQLERNRLRKRGEDGQEYDWFFTAIHAPGADVSKLRRAGFDVLSESIDADPERIREAVARGLMLMPDLDATAEGAPVDPERTVAAASSYPFRDAVAFWNLGDHLGRSRDPQVRALELERIRATIQGFRNLKGGFSRLTTGTIDGDLPFYATLPRNLDLFGIRPNAWGSTQTTLDTYQFLRQRRNLTVLSNATGLFWAWLPAAPPPVVQTAVWGQDVPPAWGYPQVLPEQIRVLTYMTLGAGYRGIGFRGNADLTRDAGRPLLIEMALLNEEIDLCESILANSNDPIPLYDTYRPDPSNLPPPGSTPNQRIQVEKEYDPHPSIRVAVLGTRDKRGALLLVADTAAAQQYQPPQMAMNDLKVVVPGLESAQAFEISPGGVRVLERDRVPGGVRISVSDFGVTSLILVTTDDAVADRIQAAIARVRPLACQLAIEQAEHRLQSVSATIGRLSEDGHRLFDPDDPKNPPLQPGIPAPNEEADLLAKSEEMIKAAREALEREDYPLAWSEARRAGRPLRILMRAHWEKANEALVKTLNPPEDDSELQARRRARLDSKKEEPRPPDYKVVSEPVCSPPLVSADTLPQHYIWLDWLRTGTFGRNLVPTGSFEDTESLEASGWIDMSHHFEGITSKIWVVREPGRDQNVLKMRVDPKDRGKLDDLPPVLDFPAAAIRSPSIRVKAGQFLRISVLVRKANPTPPGAGGLIIADSIGGETLQYRSLAAFPKFKKVVVFRRAPCDGAFTVTLGLAGYGEAYFDDLRVEAVEQYGEAPPADMAGRPRLRRPEYAPAPSTATRPPRLGTRSSR